MLEYADVFGGGAVPMHGRKSSVAVAQHAVRHGRPSGLHFRIAAARRTEVFSIISEAFEALEGWTELPNGIGLKTSWNLLWTWSRPRIKYENLFTWQRVNHFPSSRVLTRKDCLKRQLSRVMNYSSRWRGFWEIMPETYVLPGDFKGFVQGYTRAARCAGGRDAAPGAGGEGGRNLWIMKPVGSSRGRGISMVRDIGSVSYAEPVVIQRYVHNPLLMDGYKFDLRVYVLVTAFDPLEAFVYREGFARLSTRRYSLSDSAMEDRAVHLTNHAIQKHELDEMHSDNPVRQAAAGKEGEGSKVTLTYLWRWLSGRGVDADAVWKSIRTLIVKSLVACGGEVPSCPSAFELFGYDVLIDRCLRPWLIEVNASPSLGRETALDARVKDSLVRDCIALVDPLPFDRAALRDVLHARATRKRERDTPSQAAASASQGELLEGDLRRILCGRVPREYGAMPRRVGGYERLAPGTAIFREVARAMRSTTKSKVA